MTRLYHCAVACLAGAGLAVYGATRAWSVEVTARPGLPDLRAVTTGADAQPWLIALALIALAGTGAMLATRGTVRRILGVLIMLVGAGLALSAITGRAGLVAGRAGAGAVLWPIACVAGGALVLLAGLGTARYGHTWPIMGARFERRRVPRSHPAVTGADDVAPAARRTEAAPVDTRAVWDALDRGEDPTNR